METHKIVEHSHKVNEKYAEIIKISRKERDWLLSLLASDPEPNQALKNAMKEYIK
jgi:uncharacterized protein (DUF1778 family)